MSQATDIYISLTTTMKPTMALAVGQMKNEIMKTGALRKSKYYINTGSFRHHNNCGSTHPSMEAWKENKLPPSFSGFKSQKVLHESSYDGQTMRNSR